MEKFAQAFYEKFQAIAKKLPQTDSVALQGVMYGGILAVVLVFVLSIGGCVASCTPSMGVPQEGGGGSQNTSDYTSDGDDVPQGTSRLNALEREQVEKGTVVRVLDGDTIVVKTTSDKTNRVRLIGIDAPESVHPDAAKNTEAGIAASEHLKELLPEGTTVWMTCDQSNVDRYDRWLRYVWLADPKDSATELSTDMLNALLVAEGYAEPKAYPPDTRYQEEFEQIAEGTYVPDTVELSSSSASASSSSASSVSTSSASSASSTSAEKSASASSASSSK